MSNLIPDSEREIYADVIDDMHDTFARDIVVWSNSAEDIGSLNSDYDAFYDNDKKDNIVYTPESDTIKARIKYIDKQEKEFALAIASAPNQIQLSQDTQLVRIKVKTEYKTLVQDAVKIVIDDVEFGVFSSPRLHGLFSTEYTTFYLTSPV